jgi:hypothetical protein
VVEDVGDAEVSSGQLIIFFNLDDALKFCFVGGENFENEG